MYLLHQLHRRRQLAHAQRGVVARGGGGDTDGAQVGVTAMTSAHAQIAGGAAGLVLPAGKTVRLLEETLMLGSSLFSPWGTVCVCVWGGVDLGGDAGCAGGAPGVVEVQDLQVALLLHLPLQGGVPVVLDGVIGPENETQKLVRVLQRHLDLVCQSYSVHGETSQQLLGQ